MPSIIIKTADELATQRHAGELLASVFTMLDGFIQPGVTTMAINNRVEDFIVNELHSRPASKGQYDFPYVLNTSMNEVVCHGIPKESEHLKTGSIVNVDITLEKGGLIADSSKMYLIGDVSPLARRLVKKPMKRCGKGSRR
jgi:methionyl aminopeptidase